MKKQAETESVPWRDRPGHLSSSLRKTGRWWSGSGGEWLKLEQITPPRLHTMTVGSLDPYTHLARKKENQNTNLDRRHAQEGGGGGGERFDFLEFQTHPGK